MALATGGVCNLEFGVEFCLHIKGKIQIELAVLLNTAMTSNVTCILMSQGVEPKLSLTCQSYIGSDVEIGESQCGNRRPLQSMWLENQCDWSIKNPFS